MWFFIRIPVYISFSSVQPSDESTFYDACILRNCRLGTVYSSLTKRGNFYFKRRKIVDSALHSQEVFLINIHSTFERELHINSEKYNNPIYEELISVLETDLFSFLPILRDIIVYRKQKICCFGGRKSRQRRIYLVTDSY